MQAVRIEEAIGTVLCHDLTKIVPGEFKGPAFRKGHIITEQDIPELLKMGKERVYVWNLEPGMMHEDDAGLDVARSIVGQGLRLTPPQEGKVHLMAQHDGVCVINEDRLVAINNLADIVVATRNNRRPVKSGEVVAGIRVIPLVIEESRLRQVEAVAGPWGVVSVIPYSPFKIGVVTTGNEICYGHIQDRFGPVLRRKVRAYGSEVKDQLFVPDDAGRIAEAIRDLAARGAQMIITTGGMSVDPDDVTPRGIQEAGARLVAYGAPVQPGNMLLVAYYDKIPILGLPGCVMYHETTVFDLVLPWVLAGQKITRTMISRLGLGGLCLHCQECRFPNCSFGTGW